MPHALFAPFQLGDLSLTNRMVMAPMTRNCADVAGVPSASMATHYGQRATAGLIIAESTPVSAAAVGYPLARASIPRHKWWGGVPWSRRYIRLVAASFCSCSIVAGSRIRACCRMQRYPWRPPRCGPLGRR